MKNNNKKGKEKTETIQIVNFLFEVGILSKTPRSGFHLLGTGDQTVAEHVNRVSYIGYVLALMDGKVDLSKVLQMCLLHDISETRISDLNYVHQKYVERKEHKAHKDITDSIPFGDKMFSLIEEYEERKTPESILVKDADTLEWIFSLKEQLDTGNTRTKSWITPALKRLKTSNAKIIAEIAMKMDSNDWWYDKKSQKSNWWVDRNKK